jgi:SAM-dependent methyltransferase
VSNAIQLNSRQNGAHGESPALAFNPGGYDPLFFEQLARIEDKHFWVRARNHLILTLARGVASSLTPCNRLLEIGCGTGNVLRVLEKACPSSRVVGLELWFDGLRHARRRSRAALVQGDIRNSPFGTQFDLLGMFDVLEHLREDQETLELAHELLRPGGNLLVTVPGHQSLWSYFDEAAHHCRRYSIGDLRRKLEKAGFEIEFISNFMACVVPLVWCYRKLAGMRRKTKTIQQLASDEFRIVPIVNQLLMGGLYLEAKWVSRRHRLPVGTSLVAVARKVA